MTVPRYSRGMDGFDPSGDDVELPLRDRLPDYGTVFAVGFGGCVAFGVIVWLISSVALASAVGYTIILYGVVFLLAGGATGGGYTNLGIGAMGAMFGTRRADEAQDEAEESWGARSRMDPHERLRKGLRPEANPRAFWQVVGGALYIGIGLLIVIVGS